MDRRIIAPVEWFNFRETDRDKNAAILPDPTWLPEITGRTGISAHIKRQEVAQRLHEAMEGGELIEDAEYEAAKNEQAFVEGRIQELEILLANARIIDEGGQARCRPGGCQSDHPGRR